MRRSLTLLPVVAVLLLAQSPSTPASLPGWLTPWPGASETIRKSANLLRSSYMVDAEPADVVTHYQQQLNGSDVPFTSSFDGIGTVLRGSAPEGDFLIQIRAKDDGETSVAVHLAARTTRSPASQPRLDEQRTASRSRLERPVPAVPSGPGLPAVRWPAWFDHMPGADRDLEVTEAEDSSGRTYLVSSFQINAPMTSVRDYYHSRIWGGGFSELRTSVATGDTLAGERQNATGYVEGVQYPNGKGNGKLKAHVAYYREYLNGPINVKLTVRATRR